MTHAHVPLFGLLLIALFLSVAGVGEDYGNARAVVWESKALSSDFDGNGNPVTYKTQTTYHSEVVGKLNDLAERSEVVVLFNSPSASVNIIAELKGLIESSKTALLLPDVQVDKHVRDRKLLSDSLLEIPLLSKAQKVSSEELSELLTGDRRSEYLNNKRVDVFHVRVEKPQEIKVLSKLKGIAGLVCIATEENNRVQAVPKQAGQYHRILSATRAVTPMISFSMYKENTNYLYMTPDLFTGLMTALFFAFILYLGFSYLVGIQGPTSFIMKGPDVGREA